MQKNGHSQSGAAKKAASAAKFALGTVRVLIYPVLIALFFACLSIANPYLIVINRTLATTLVAITASSAVFSHVYGGFRIGELKKGTVAANTWTGMFMSDCFAYVILEIMNVNARNRRSLDLGQDLVYLVLAACLQFIVIAAAVWIADELYHRIYPPRRGCVITDTEESAREIWPKLEKCGAWFKASSFVTVDDPALFKMIDGSDCAVLYHLPPDLHYQLVEYCYRYDKPVFFDTRLGDIVIRGSESLFVDDILINTHRHHGLSLRQRFAKRVCDIAVSFVMLAILSPVMAVCAILIRAEDGSPVIFRQQRVTQGGRVFTIFKFRTMKKEGSDESRSAVTDDERITRVGRTLRRFRLDEIPQLANILIGDMSLVGPRPEMLANVEKYTAELPEFRYRSKVKAGLTGYAQIMGKYNTPAYEKLMMDMSYINNYSLWLDVEILFRTALAILSPESTEAFDGKENGNGNKDGKDN